MATEKRLIDANALEDDCDIFDARDAKIVKAWLEDQPTVDAVEVVRCGECEHWESHEINGKKLLGRCKKLRATMRNDGFCSYGERKPSDG